jgi:hypothetical protein
MTSSGDGYEYFIEALHECNDLATSYEINQDTYYIWSTSQDTCTYIHIATFIIWYELIEVMLLCMRSIMTIIIIVVVVIAR